MARTSKDDVVVRHALSIQQIHITVEENDIENESTEFSLEAQPAIVKEQADHQKVVIFKKENTDEDKPVQVVNLPPVSL